jgi:restriction endonuclease S subunit
MLPSFLRYFTASANYWQWLSSSTIQATIQNVSAEKYTDLWLTYPPIAEQQTIADFLDAQTAKIDTLLAKKRLFIAKLKEKRSALIARTVTRGLPPDAAKAAGLESHPAMKDSGVEWLDKMPTHWDAAALRWMSRRYSGGTPDKSNDSYWEEGEIPWLNSGAVNDGYITEPSALITQEGFAKSSAKWIPKGALVMALAGQGKTKGMVAQLGFQTTCNQSMAAIIPDHRLDPRYLYWWLSANYQNIRNMAGGEARDGLNLDLLGSIQCPLPPVIEQRAIATYLDRETARIDQLAAKVEAAIARLTEYRQALITAAVTGKIDVRARSVG